MWLVISRWKPVVDEKTVISGETVPKDFTDFMDFAEVRVNIKNML